MSTENPLEREVEAYLVKRAKAVGWLCFKFVSPNNRGVPDRLAILQTGETVYIEVKRRTGSLSALQHRMFVKMLDQGARVFVVYGRMDVDDLVDLLALARDNEATSRYGYGVA